MVKPIHIFTNPLFRIYAKKWTYTLKLKILRQAIGVVGREKCLPKRSLAITRLSESKKESFLEKKMKEDKQWTNRKQL